ncbi:MAG: CHAD domain-containing protein [Arcobacteraceae bacterium]|nr:CHAD domain-containing protein [Arcobacteraceae bacterium]
MGKRIDKKILKIKKLIEHFISSDSYGIDDIHKIRISTRKSLCLLRDKKLNCKYLKRIIKLSNKIRDIDVFLYDYLTKIPPKYQLKINTTVLKDILHNKREEEIKKFLTYLEIFLVKKIKFLQSNQIDKPTVKPRLSLNIKKLHKYRIYIKNQFYAAKNETKKDKMKIKFLEEIKNLLGNINDNHNAIKIIKKLNLNKVDTQNIVNYTNKQNKSYFKKVKKLISNHKLF